MAPLRCGCEEIELARKMRRDPEAAAVQRAVGEEDARKWRCPFVCGGKEPREPAPEAIEPLQEVAATIHATGLTTCPNWYASQPAARVALRARKWAERGLLRERFGKPSLALMEAVDELDEALEARERDDDERREEELKRKRNG